MQATSKIYVAGHTGLIGSAVVRALASCGFLNLVTRTREDLELTDKNKVDTFFAKEAPEYVILAAGKVGGIIDNQAFPADFISQNLAIQYNIIQAAHRFGVRRLILFASSCMYPRECSQPMAEIALMSGKPELTSLSYAVAKFAGMQMCLAYNQQYKNKNFIPVIPNSVYGPNDNFDPASSHVLSALIRRFHEAKISGARDITLWGSGSSRREFIHSDDVAAAILSILEAELCELELPINIGSGSDYSIRELAELISEVVEFRGKINWDTSKPDGAPRKLLDSSRLLSTGWQPRVEFKHGLKSTYDWFLQNHCR